LRDKKDLVRAILITHGHLDHIGAVTHLLRQVSAPVYATRLARGLLEVKLKHERMLEQAVLHTYAAGDVLDIGPFTIEPYHVCHSIPDSVGLGITTPAGLIVHSGDFKLDPAPVDGWPTDQAKLAEFGRRGVLVLLSDSTNADSPGSTPSETVLDGAFDQIMRQAPGRLIIATFASLISRIQQVVHAAQRHDRRIAIAGQSMVENAEMARELGYLRIPDGMLVSLNDVDRLPPRQVVIMATGSQGEPMAILNRLATDGHHSLHIQEGDTVLLSSHIIPGNEEMAYGVINRLFQRGADVLYGPQAQAHVSGHASQEELKRLIQLLRPRFFVPIHGELRHLVGHAKLAHELGIAKKDIAVVENGYPLAFDDQGMHIGKRVPGGHVFVDGSLAGEVSSLVVHQRDGLAQSGFVTAVAPLDRHTGTVLGEPRFITRGFVYAPDAEGLLAQAGDVVRAAASKKRGAAPGNVEKQVEQVLSDFFYRETRRRPVVTVALMEV
jgi:ribonuclease J